MCGEHVHFSTQQLNSSHRLTANLSMGMGCKNYANFIVYTRDVTSSRLGIQSKCMIIYSNTLKIASFIF